MEAPEAASIWDELALVKLANILGRPAAVRVMREVLAELRLGGLTSADELYRFSQALSSRDGFVGAVGAMLSVTALMRGARGAGDP